MSSDALLDDGQFGGGPAGDTVVKVFEFVSVEIEAMDHAGGTIRDEKLLVHRIKREIAEARTGVRISIEDHIGKQRHLPGFAIDFPDAIAFLLLGEGLKALFDERTHGCGRVRGRRVWGHQRYRAQAA